MGGSMSSVVISGDTSGAITLAAPAVAGTNTITLPAATGTVMVSGNMPAFSAYLSSNQIVTNSTITKVTFNTKEFDTNSNYDSTTNYRFTPTIAGYYQVNLTLDLSGSGSPSRFIGFIYKNGSEFKRPFDIQSSAVGNGFSGSQIIYMNGSTDYIESYVYITAVSTPTVASGANLSYFQASLVRAA